MNIQDLSQIIHKQSLRHSQAYTAKIVKRSLDLSAEISKPEISVISGVRRCGKSQFTIQLKRKLEPTTPCLLIEFDDPALGKFNSEDFDSLQELFKNLFLNNQL